MNPDDLQTDLVHPAEREILEELAEDFDEDIDPERLLKIVDKLFPKRGRGAVLQTTSYPGAFISALQPKPSPPKRKKRSKSNLSALDREIFRELNDEVKELEKESRRLPAVPSRKELADLLETVQQAGEEGSVKDRRDYLILRLLYATGCRRSELENMVYADLNLAEQRIIVRDGKGNKDRYVLIDKQTAELLEDFTSAHQYDTPLFDIEDKQINRRIVHWAEVTGLVARYEGQGRSFTSHSLRHCFATHMYENGADLYTLRELLGHKYLSTTKLYVSIGIGTLLNKYRSAHPLAEG